MKILIGGAPFGQNNLGDEAFLACVVRIVKGAAPTAQITVSTDDPTTSGHLGVEVCPLLGFEDTPRSSTGLEEKMTAHDIFLLASPDSLSASPERLSELLTAAREASCERIIWNAEMNPPCSSIPQSAPAPHGKNHSTFPQIPNLLSSVLHAFQENWQLAVEKANRQALVRELLSCRLLVTRNEESSLELRRCGIPGPCIVTGADSTLLQAASPWPVAGLSPTDLEHLSHPVTRRVGLCLSADPAITRWETLVTTLDALLEFPDLEIVGLPINPLTDLTLLQRLRHEVRQRHKFRVITGINDPADFTALAARMDVLISSNLSLLILGSTQHVPLIGLCPGSVADSFLAPYDLQALGPLDSCDFSALLAEVRRLLDHKFEFIQRSRNVRQSLLTRLDKARHLLRSSLQEIQP